MTGDNGGNGEGAALVEELRVARGETARVVAVLWTWLDRHLLELGSLREKLPRIRALAAKEVREGRRFDGVDDAVLEWVAEAPLRNAAELLARIHLSLGKPSEGLMAPSVGFGGEDVVVAWRRTDLVRMTGGYDHPPAADEHPSLATLAPSLLVCPVAEGGIELLPRRLEGLEGELVRNALENALQGDPPPVEVHLDTLSTAGLPADWETDHQLGLAALIDEMAEDEKQVEVAEAVGNAVRAAAGSSRILVLPELAASDETLVAIREALIELDGDGPALTVVGRYHRVGEGEGGDAELLEGAELGRYVNEAMVLGPFGGELWRHRKFTSAGGEVPTEDGDRYAVEDIRLGRALTVVDTPMGTLAVPICLDTFAAHGRARLERSPANVLLVPSLSRSVKRHRSSLGLLVGVLWGVAFVCNRWIEWSNGKSNWNSPENRSFWAIQGDKEEIDPIESAGDRPSFVFALGELPVN